MAATFCSVVTFGNVRSPFKNPDPLMSLRASDHEGLGQSLSGSWTTGSSLLWNRSSTASMILIIRCGGLANFLTRKEKNVSIILIGEHTGKNVYVSNLASHMMYFWLTSQFTIYLPDIRCISHRTLHFIKYLPEILNKLSVMK